MATGFESPTPSPLDSSEFLRKMDRNILVLLGRIFGDKSGGNVPSIQDLLEDPFFNAVNVPRSDISGFLALKQENDTVERLVTAARRQCLERYSTEILLGDNVSRKSQSASTPRKKKKKRKKKREKMINGSNGTQERSVTSSASSLFPADSASSQIKEKDTANEMEHDAVDNGNVVSQAERDDGSADDLWSSQ